MTGTRPIEPAVRPLPVPSWLALPAYALGANLILPPSLALAAPFLLARPKRRRTLLPRLGWQPYPRLAPGTLAPVWVHALSVGELLSAVPFIRGLRVRLEPRPVVVSVSTLAARELAESRLGDSVAGMFYFPYDTALAYRRCIQRVGPALFLLIETDIWPGYLRHLRRCAVPCWLLNGRLSPTSFAQRRRWACLFGPAMDCFERVHGQSPAENDRFRQTGVPQERLGEPGNLKFDACGSPATAESIGQLQAELGYASGDPVLLAGSTHPGEDEIVRRVFLELRAAIPTLKLIAVPRHPQRAQQVQSLFAGDRLRTGRFTERPRPAPDVLIVDQLGQNPIEPALAGKPVLFGPDMSDFPDVAPELVAAGGAFALRDEADFLARCRELLADPVRAASAGQCGRRVVESHAGITGRLVEAVAARLQRGAVMPTLTGVGTGSLSQNMSD
jgi:3-deoxy-D-manno-octulosonic-acid transferase